MVQLVLMNQGKPSLWSDKRCNSFSSMAAFYVFVDWKFQDKYPKTQIYEKVQRLRIKIIQ